MPIPTIPQIFFKQAETRQASPAYYVKTDGQWIATSWTEYAAIVRKAARALIALGVERGGAVAILGFNRPEWVLMDVAAICAGGAPVGIYTTSSPSEVQYIIHHAEARVVLLENALQWAKVEKELARLPLLRHVVMMKGAPPIQHPMILTWEAFLARGDTADDHRLAERIAALEPNALATLIYTSGTTGPPKGVMLSHENLVWTAGLVKQLNQANPLDTNMSYLPLSHIAEQVMTIHLPIVTGSTVYFAEALEKVPENLKEVQPTMFFGVPRIWEKFYAGVRQKLSEAPKARRAVVDAAMKIGLRYQRERNAGRTPNPVLAAAYRTADQVVFSKLKEALGFSHVRFAISGAAPIAREIIEFFGSLGIVIYEVYGQSEGSGPTSLNLPGRTRFGTVGPPLPGVAVEIAEDGEILVKGPNVFLGYYKDPEATAATLSYGWLRSGDLGQIDAEGFLSIIGRKKEILITSGGKNIAPKNIEAALKNHPLISEAVVIGDRRKYLTAVVTLDAQAADQFMKTKGLSGPAHERPELCAVIQSAIDEVNGDLAQVETVKKFKILPRAFSIETGELTPTLKVKRSVVYRNFSAEIEAMYAE